MIHKRRVVGSQLWKRSIMMRGHKTSVRLEDAFWRAISEIAIARGLSINQLVAAIDADRTHANLPSVIRLFVLEHYRRLAEEAAPAGRVKQS